MTLESRVIIRFLVLLGVLVALAAPGCGGSTASYTRFRREAAAGRAPRAEEIRASDFVAYHAQADVPRPAPALATLPGESVTLLDAQLGNPHLPAGEPAVPILQVALRGGAAAVRYPAYVVVVVDVSGSMREGDKIGAVRHALARFVETLDPADRIAIVTFADDAHLALPPTRVGDARGIVLGAIGGLEAYGGTNLEAGLRAGLGLAYAGDVEPSSVVRVVLLSDGVPSIGVTAPDAIIGLASRRDVREAPITAIGMGSEIDYGLLDAIGRASGGAFHYLDQPSEVERLFSTELRALTEVAARDTRIRVRLPPGWSLVRALDERTRLEGGEIVTELGDLGGDEASVVLAELRAAPGYAPEAIDVSVEYVDGTGQVAILARTQITTARDGMAPYVAAEGGTLLRNTALARAALAMRDASVLRARGEGFGSQQMLSVALGDLCDARARLLARGETDLASSLDEVVGLTAGIAPPPATSGSFAGWRSEPGWAPPAHTIASSCGSAHVGSRR